MFYNATIVLIIWLQKSMKLSIASWNINSINIRLEHVIAVINEFAIDILGIQETKCSDQNFPIDALHEAGFHVIFNGQKSYNGTAFIAKMPLSQPQHQLPAMPTDYQRRFLQVSYKNLSIINCYVPNGKSVGDEKYDYKLRWLDALESHLKQLLTLQKNIVLIGDFNIAPDDRDVYDAEAWRDKILCSTAERKRLEAIKALGLSDTFRLFNQEDSQFSWWDYRDAGYQKNKGHRIDLILSSDAMTPNCQSSIIATAPRGWDRPSDHAPVIADFLC